MRPVASREEWLRACLTRITAGWPAGADLPENTRISVGFPMKAHGRGASRTSEHYRPSESTGGLFEIFISPTIADALEVAASVALEAARIATGRQPSESELTALRDRARAVIRTLPAYPHSALKSAAKPTDGTVEPGKGSRLIKVSCPHCEYTARITRKWLRVAVPVCPHRADHGLMLVQVVGV